MQPISYAEPSATCAPLDGALLTISSRMSQAMCSATLWLSLSVNYGTLQASAAGYEMSAITLPSKASKTRASGILPVHVAGSPGTLPSLGNVENVESSRYASSA